MRYLILTIFLLITLRSYSQDLIILRNGNQLDCKITKIDSTVIHYDFYNGERKLSSYISRQDIRSYTINSTGTKTANSSDLPEKQDQTVVIDTTRYVKATRQWINMLTYCQRYGAHAYGWSVQYYGFNMRSTSNWTIPIILCFEGFTIYPDYFSQFHYQAAEITYISAGISPFYKLRDGFFFNLGLNIIAGQEELSDFNGTKYSYTIFGISPAQGIYFIPRAKPGITLGVSCYQKLLDSEVYKNDIGIKFEIGIKF